ncbi:MAG: DUF3391 domain-containing protein [Burkholderiales bacterium]|nr:DUF3391 domain-containing protein [Burkholderiales bacterium]
MNPLVATQDLMVGMYVHLDLPWVRHPFPRSSFRISSPAQIEVIRELGLREVRWAPERSLPERQPPEHAQAAAGGASTEAAAPHPVHGAAPAPPARSTATAPRRAGAPVLAAVDGARSAPPPSAALRVQQAVQRRLQRDHAQASGALLKVLRGARARPQQAGANAQTLARALVDRLPDDTQACIRLLPVAGGDRATAHGMNVAVVALLMGRVFGLGDEELVELGQGALLHDVGKLELPEALRAPPGSAGDAEALRRWREHVPLGLQLGQRMGLASGALTVVAQHHEHDDGSGFPHGLAAEHIALGARIVSLADRYDNLCNPARACAALTPHEAMAALFCGSQGRDDATMLAAFVRLMGVYPPGSLVELGDGRLAVVVSVDAARPLRPRVRVHDPRLPPEEALLLDLARCEGLAIRRSLHAAALPPAARRDLAPHARLTYFFEPPAPQAVEPPIEPRAGDEAGAPEASR